MHLTSVSLCSQFLQTFADSSFFFTLLSDSSLSFGLNNSWRNGHSDYLQGNLIFFLRLFLSLQRPGCRLTFLQSGSLHLIPFTDNFILRSYFVETCPDTVLYFKTVYKQKMSNGEQKLVVVDGECNLVQQLLGNIPCTGYGVHWQSLPPELVPSQVPHSGTR